MIDQETAQRIKDAADIVEVVSDYVHLVRRGGNYMGLCPFHNERTPSFSVNKRKNFCYCFSCKKGGSPVNFLMQKEGISYHDALLQLAKKYGIEVHERDLTDEERQAQSEREAMLVANEWAMNKMEADMHDTEEGRDIGLQYFFQRGVTVEAARKYHLGYALDKGYALVDAAKKAGHDINVLKTLGLIGTSQQGRDYDRFRGRVIFPIMNSSGKVVAFGGRDLKGGLAKYINSPESKLYKKSNELYGMFQARPEIVKEDKCFLVEGYLDVIGMWQSGMKNVVASSGTALTDGQIDLIHRFTSNITLIYDGDSAGIKASLRGIDMLLSHNMQVKVLLLPDVDDPDSFARKHTPEEFRNYVADHETDIIRFKASVLLEDVKSDPQKRIDAVNSVVLSLAHISNPISRDIYIQECSRILSIPESTISSSVSRTRRQLTEKWRYERERKSIDRDFPLNQSQSDISSQSDKIQTQHADSRTIASGQTVPNDGNLQSAPLNREISNSTSSVKAFPLKPLEEKIVRYCLKYGFLNFCYSMDTTGAKAPMSVLDFIEEELRVDNIHFTVDIYGRIFSLLLDLKPFFNESLKNKIEEVNSIVDNRRKTGIEEIASRDLMMNEIEREEKKLEDSLASYANSELTEFTKEFPGRQLASHENDDVRVTVTELIREKHQLSNIYFKEGYVTETEQDKLPTLIPRALTELKCKILDLELSKLMQEMKAVQADKNENRVLQIQMQISSLQQIRREIARDIGDRVIIPRIK